MQRNFAMIGGVLLAVASLSGCGMVKSMANPYVEPVGGETAKIRVVTNGRVRFLPGTACVNWSLPGIGIVASNDIYIGSRPHHNGQTLGMKAGEPLKDNYVAAEVLVRANEPVTIYFDSEALSGDMKYWCNPIAKAFIPLAGEEYEAYGAMDDKCWLYVKDLSRQEKYPAQRWVEDCK